MLKLNNSYPAVLISRVDFCSLRHLTQYKRAKKTATPALIHFSGESLVGNSNHRQKLVEWPVVDRVPVLLSTLYMGQL